MSVSQSPDLISRSQNNNIDHLPCRIEKRREIGTFNLHPNLEHPFYFDHPLTHLPGLMLLELGLCGIRTQMSEETRSSLALCRFEVQFRSIVGMRSPMTATVEHQDGLVTCALAQDGKTKVEVMAEFGPRVSDRSAAPLHDGESAPPIDRTTVRKTNPGNVFLARSRIDEEDDRYTLRPPEDLQGCALPLCEGPARHPVFLTECFLQLCRTLRPEPSFPAPGEAEKAPTVSPSREVLVLLGGTFSRPVGLEEIAWIGFRPDTPVSYFRPHPRATRRTAQIFNKNEVVSHFFCDTLKI